MTKQTTELYDHAIVLGASMAGLVTAQALSKHFRRVTIIERDLLPEEPAARVGVPQGDHLHVLLAGGADALESLLPGFADGLIASGAVPVAVPTDVLWLNPAGWVRRFPSKHQLLSASRDLIEWQARRLVTSAPGVSIVDGRSVLDLCLSPDGARVAGVTVVCSARAGTSSNRPVDTLFADLIVDATGRRSRLPDWLERLGFDRPAETRIDAHLAYATRIYRLRADPSWKGIFIQPKAPITSRMGVMFPLEGDRWMVTVQGAGDERPPTDEAGFDEYVGTLRDSAISDAIRGAEPLTSPVAFANTSNRRRHYDKVPGWPERLLVVGDSACAFNPVYGQGISVAAKTAVALDAQLDRHRRTHSSLDGFVRPMQRRVAKQGDAAWMIATGDDLRMPTTTGAKATALTRFQHRYLDRVLAAATSDETVQTAMMQVMFLVAPPTILFRPNIVVRSLWPRRRRSAGDGAPIPSTLPEEATVG